MQRRGSRPRIENIVASTSIAESLDLDRCCEILHGAQYAPKRFPGLIYRQTDPKTAMLLFTSGKANCTGAKTIEDVHRSVHQAMDLLIKDGINVNTDAEIRIQNMVAVGDLGVSLNLNQVTLGLGLDRTEFEPEQFPGMVYRMEDPGVVILLFASGKIVITGATDQSSISRSYESLSESIDAITGYYG
jgi:transcription initiation factor TFIID TATA-box-binding protein